MELKKLRSVSERKEVLSDDGKIHTHTMVFVVGGTHSIRTSNDTTPKRMTVCSIEEAENKYLVYLKEGDEVQLWREISKNEYVNVEHFIS